MLNNLHSVKLNYSLDRDLYQRLAAFEASFVFIGLNDEIKMNSGLHLKHKKAKSEFRAGFLRLNNKFSAA